MDAFLGEIRPFGFTFNPRNWMLCNGQLLPISQYTALFSLLGTYYGGNGQTNFALPNIQGTTLVGQGTAVTGTIYDLGETGGTPGVSLLSTEIPAHSHTFNAMYTTDAASAPTKEVNVATPVSYLSDVYEVPPPTTKRQGNFYSTAPPSTVLNPLAVNPTGGNQPHSNMQPYLVINYCICINGYFPQRP